MYCSDALAENDDEELLSHVTVTPVVPNADWKCPFCDEKFPATLAEGIYCKENNFRVQPQKT